VRKERG
jgi:uncharacterized protein YbbK (DUF523 family)